jgi:hypothetical protein
MFGKLMERLVWRTELETLDQARRDHDSNCSRSASVSSIDTTGTDGMTPPSANAHELKSTSLSSKLDGSGDATWHRAVVVVEGAGVRALAHQGAVGSTGVADGAVAVAQGGRVFASWDVVPPRSEVAERDGGKPASTDKAHFLRLHRRSSGERVQGGLSPRRTRTAMAEDPIARTTPRTASDHARADRATMSTTTPMRANKTNTGNLSGL